MKQTYDRRAIMAHANRLCRDGMPRAEAMKAAWASAKSGALYHAPRQQQAGVKAALRRYGVDADKLAIRAQEAVRAIVAAVNVQRPALLPPPAEKAIELKRGADGVYRA